MTLINWTLEDRLDLLQRITRMDAKLDMISAHQMETNRHLEILNSKVATHELRLNEIDRTTAVARGVAQAHADIKTKRTRHSDLLIKVLLGCIGLSGAVWYALSIFDKYLGV